MFLTTRGLVLREVRYKESDKILTVLTQHEGKVTVRARGALRKGSRITAATQLLTYSDMTIFENRGRRTLNEASTVEEFLGLRADLGAFALGSYFAELLETVSAEEYPDPPVLQLGLTLPPAPHVTVTVYSFFSWPAEMETWIVVPGLTIVPPTGFWRATEPLRTLSS